MTEIEAILTAAKRYCIDQFNYWSDQYAKNRTGSDFPSYTYSDNDYDLFPRYNAANAILQTLEFYTKEDFSDSEACKQALKKAGQEGQSLFTRGKQNKIAAKAIQDERDKFDQFIDHLEADFLKTVKPLPYKRRLKTEEQSELNQKLRESWGVDGYWHPLIEIEDDKKAIFIKKEHLEAEDYRMISNFINQNSSGKRYEVSEDKIDYELKEVELNSNAYEKIYCDETFSWIIYASHEDTLSFGGEKLVNFVKELLKDRKELIDRW